MTRNKIALTTIACAVLIMGSFQPVPVSVLQGGTGATTVSGARTALGLTKTTCTLDGTATPTCTAAVPANAVCTCSYSSSTLLHIVACALVSTTLTAASATTLDAGVVNITCIGP